MAKWRASNVSRSRELAAASYRKHREERIKKQITYERAHPRDRRAEKRTYYEATKSRRLEASRAYYSKNRESILKRYAAWRKANPDRVKAILAKQYESIKAMGWSSSFDKRKAPGRHNYKQIAELFTKQRGRCAACMTVLGKYHRDHILPIVLGGTHDIYNIQLLCVPCNKSKFTKDPIDFMQSRGFLL